VELVVYHSFVLVTAAKVTFAHSLLVSTVLYHHHHHYI